MSLVVLIDDDPLQARLITDNLRSVGHNVARAGYEWEGLLLVDQLHPDLVIVDCSLPQWNELLAMLRKVRGVSRTPLMLIASRRPPHYYLKKYAVSTCLEKHFDAADFVRQVDETIRRTTRLPELSTGVEYVALAPETA